MKQLQYCTQIGTRGNDFANCWWTEVSSRLGGGVSEQGLLEALLVAGSQPDGSDKATDTCGVHPHPLVDEFEKPFSSSEDETDSLSTSPDSPVQSCAQDAKNILLKPQLSTAESSTELVCNNPVELSEIQWYAIIWLLPMPFHFLPVLPGIVFQSREMF